MRIVVVDYGAGNLRSVVRAAAHLGYDARISSQPQDVQTADVLIVPGVGAAADTMSNLRRRGLVQPILDYIAGGRPYLGICMGMQALFTVSEEGGEHQCLNVLPGRVRRLPAGLKVPQMGWNQVRRRRPHPIFEGIPDDSYFYFVHSYYPDPDDADMVIGETDYGVTFPSLVAKGKVIAAQFHPEKSGDVGLLLYRNFLAWVKREQ